MSETIANWLPEDLTGAAVTNYVQDEEHALSSASSANNKIIITPNYGAFYNSSDLKVTLVNGEVETELTRDSEFRVIGLDHGRTKASSSPAGVYHFILLTTSGSNAAFAGCKIKLSYQAFGGVMTSAAYMDLLNRVRALEANELPTGASVNVEALADIVQILCRRLNYNPTAPYRIQLSADTTKWHTIAWSSPDLDSYINLNNAATLTGTGKFSIYSTNFHMTFELSYDIPALKAGTTPTTVVPCDLKINVSNQQVSNLDVDEELEHNNYFSGKRIIIPKFRLLVFNNNSRKLYLQIALMSNVSSNTPDYTIYVDNESNYLSVPSPDSSDLTDSWELCPDANTDNLTPYAQSKEVLGLQDYFKVWEGNVSMAAIEDLAWTPVTLHMKYNVQNDLTPKHTENGYVLTPYGIKALASESVKSFKVDIYDRLDQIIITKTFNASVSQPYGGRTNTTYGIVNFYPFDNGILELMLETGSTPSIHAYGCSGKNTYVNKRFDLRAIYIK